MPTLKQDILGSDIAMNHAVLVRVAESVSYFAGNAQRVGDGQLLFPIEPRTERLTFDERLYLVEQTARVSGIQQRKNVRMPEPRGRAYLRQESLAAEGRSEIGMQDLYGDIAVVPDVVRQMDSRHAALPDLGDRCGSDRSALRQVWRLQSAVGPPLHRMPIGWRNANIRGARQPGECFLLAREPAERNNPLRVAPGTVMYARHFRLIASLHF